MPITDAHHRALPAQVIGLFDADPGPGVTITDGQWIGVQHVPFAAARRVRRRGCTPVHFSRYEIG